MGSAAKTVIELLGGAYGEGGRLFGMKGAKTAVISTRFFKADVLTNDIGHINPLKQVVNKRRRNHACIMRCPVANRPHVGPCFDGFKILKRGPR